MAGSSRLRFVVKVYIYIFASNVNCTRITVVPYHVWRWIQLRFIRLLLNAVRLTFDGHSTSDVKVKRRRIESNRSSIDRLTNDRTMISQTTSLFMLVRRRVRRLDP